MVGNFTDRHSNSDVEVHVKSLKTGERVAFRISEGSTLEATWGVANEMLKETRSPEDTIRCADGTDLMSHLNQTLRQIRDEKVCVNLHFEIKGPSGGADA